MPLSSAEKNRAYRQRQKEKDEKAWNLRQAAYARSSRARLKKEMIEAYGGCCSCCGESNHLFLSLDHKNGREDHDDKNGVHMWALARRLGWPDCYTVLCFNCNQGRQINGGICPHKELVNVND